MTVLKKGNVLTTTQVIKSLERLESGWPDDLWLLAASGTLVLMGHGPDGKRMVLGEYGEGGMDPNAAITSFNIPCDGGDW